MTRSKADLVTFLERDLLLILLSFLLMMMEMNGDCGVDEDAKFSPPRPN